MREREREREIVLTWAIYSSWEIGDQKKIKWRFPMKLLGLTWNSNRKKKKSKPNENEKSESTRTTLVINSKNHSKLTD